MLKKLTNFLFSTRLTAVLFIVFAAAMATGTILDRNMDTSPTPYTRTLIYNAWWFEAIMVLFVINFVGNISRYRLLRKEKWAVLILHISWILIIVGAAITRYISYEGVMPIREGATENQFLSEKTFISGRIVGDYKVNGQLMQKPVEETVDFSPRLNNKFNKSYTYGNAEVTITLKDFITNAEKDVIANETGKRYLKIVEASGGQPHNHFLEDGKTSSLHNVLISLNKYQQGAINITETKQGLQIQSPFEGEYMTMATGTTGKLVKDSLQPLMLRSRYIIGNMQMVFPKPIVKGNFGVVKKSQLLKNDADGVVLEVSANGETKTLGLLGGKGKINPAEVVNVGGVNVELQYGSKLYTLPYAIKLNDFIAEKYPGSANPSTFESKITVLDTEAGNFDYHIYMNHILDHKGYRFFQASYDPDEKGTILSVNHDRWGTLVTYAGYFLLYFGLMAILFAKHTRFDSLRNQLKKIKKKKAQLLTIAALSFGLFGYTQQHTANDGHNHRLKFTQAQIDSILTANITPKAYADAFAKTVIQDYSGRMMPMHTYASEILRKLSKQDTYNNFEATQVLLSMQESPMLWYQVPIIYLAKRKADTVRSVIGLSTDKKYASLVDFFDENGNLKIRPYLDRITKTDNFSAIEKQFKEAENRVYLLYNVLEGRSIKIFPVPDEDNNTWISSLDFREGRFKEHFKDSTYNDFVKNAFYAYLVVLNNAKTTNDYSKPLEMLKRIKQAQQKYGSNLMLSDQKIKTEIQYNKIDIFNQLFVWYLLASLLLLALVIFQIFYYKSKPLNISVKVGIAVVTALFAIHTFALIVRWYLSGHAPWSDAYESMLYVAWSTMLFGLLFGRQSSLTIAASAFVVAIILMVAHWNWMDPAIANLQPVLNSYWVLIHVSVIVASYGPFALGWILGIVALFLMIFTNKKNKERVLISLKEITIITEMALTVGLVMLTIGNFLGGMWANESWGRYWGWDPKETWALISIMIYAFVVHMRLIPGLRGLWGFNLASILAFFSILMTYFGVNFYLSGLHAYASGDQIISFKVVAIYLACIVVLAVFSFRKYKKYLKK